MASQAHLDALEQSSVQLRTLLVGGTASLNATVLVPTTELGGAPTSLTLSRHGNLWALLHTHVVVRVTQTGELTVVAGKRGCAGNKSGHPLESRFDFGFWSSGIVEMPNGDKVFTDPMNNVLRLLREDESYVTTYAGCGLKGQTDGPLLSARFSLPSALCCSSDGTVFVTDTDNGLVRKISAESVTTLWKPSEQLLATTSTLLFPAGLAFTSRGRLLVSDSLGHTIHRVSEEDTSAVIGKDGGFVDGPLDEAKLYKPAGLALSSFGDLFICDGGNHAIRALVDGRIVSVFAPTDLPSLNALSQSRNAKLYALFPTALVVGYASRMFVADLQGIVTLSGEAEFSPPLPAELLQAECLLPTPSNAISQLVNECLIPTLDKISLNHVQIMADSFSSSSQAFLAPQSLELARHTHTLLGHCALLIAQELTKDYPDSHMQHIENTISALQTFASCFPSSPLFLTNLNSLKDCYSLFPKLFGGEASP